MENKKRLVEALMYYDIEIVETGANFIRIGRGYKIEIEANGLYKLFSNEQVIAPFDDLDELCRFVLL